MGFFEKLFGSYSSRELKHITPIKDKILSLEEHYRSLSDDELRAMTPQLKERLANGATLDDILPDAFAACREASDRVLGMRPFPVQLIGGIVLHQGRIAEMKTGEGKTLVAVLPAYLNALEGKGVHIVTVNEYLAQRDSQWMGKVHNFMGLSVGLVARESDRAGKQAAYNADITYGTNNEMGFDYLRDNMVIYKQDKVQRGFHYAIVDEVDSILIDEARTPLIISGQGDKSTDLYKQADSFASTLKPIKVAEMDMKSDNEDFDADYIVDEKAKSATLTKSGVKKAERFFGIENLMDAEHMTLQHHISQAIKARGVMQRDVDYVVKDGEVIIVDEFTGRLMIGRRYNEGLHQAIEAKEHVEVARESKTLATITFQNYFRLYEKLSGMTGTALTEADEFSEIYKLETIEIPTNKPVIRKDQPDVVYKTEKGKYNAIIEQVIRCHEKGQPVLVGTVSIEKSELLSSLLKRRGIQHEVLNAKYHEKEAEIVAQAGKFGAVTIATNMAGRGTDIMLGGNPEFLAKVEMRKADYPEELYAEMDGYSETDDADILAIRKAYRDAVAKYKAEIREEADKVREAGGLYILGTERHESRRIDNQLRGRSGRQGDPGESRFFISLEDDLMRLFGGERMQAMMNTLGVDEDTPLENKMLSGTIESAQSKVEQRNFAIRKNVLQFDDVMNRQREIIYGQRSQVLSGEDMGETIQKMLVEQIAAGVDTYVRDPENREEWNVAGLVDYYTWLFDEEHPLSPAELETKSKEEITRLITERAQTLYKAREEQFTPKVMRELERVILLRNVDEKWMDHIDAMDELRRGMGLRAYGQHDPVVEYRLEGFDMFDSMVSAIREDTVKMLLTVHLVQGEAPKREQVAKPTSASSADDGTVKKKPRKVTKVGRNDPCPCGSGKKYKHCCGR